MEENRKRYREMVAVCKPISVERAHAKKNPTVPSQIKGDLEL